MKLVVAPDVYDKLKEELEASAAGSSVLGAGFGMGIDIVVDNSLAPGSAYEVKEPPSSLLGAFQGFGQAMQGAEVAVQGFNQAMQDAFKAMTPRITDNSIFPTNLRPNLYDANDVQGMMMGFQHKPRSRGEGILLEPTPLDAVRTVDHTTGDACDAQGNYVMTLDLDEEAAVTWVEGNALVQWTFETP